jgi:hypothetical protein
MDDIALASLFVEYASLKKELDRVAALLEAEALEREETIKMAGVTVTYYHPGFDFDYEAAGKAAVEKDPSFDLSPYTTIKEYVRWKEVCLSIYGEDGIPDNVPYEERPARAAIR